MDELLLARWQFGVTTVYHFFFVPLTLGLSVFLAVVQTVYFRTGDEVYRKMARFWGTLFTINFAMGVVTGIVQEFQFGMNWSEYSRFVGDVFGAPLAIEALLAFFLESTFLGLWVFGWDRLPKKVHLASIWAVAVGSNLSAFWILVANSFMQNPVGYILRNGHAEMTDIFALVGNPYLWTQFPHVITSGMTTAAFFVLGVSLYHVLRKTDEGSIFLRSFRFAASYALFASLAVALVGHAQTQRMEDAQPMKLAALDALWETENPAALSVIAVIDESKRENSFALRIPYLLSFFCYNVPYGEVRGLKALQSSYEKTYGPGDYLPSVLVSFWTFRLMIAAGIALVGLALLAIFMSLREARFGQGLQDRLWKWSFRVVERWPICLWLVAGMVMLPYLANSSGWLLTEMGRQPWIVFGLLKTTQGVSTSVPGGQVFLTLAGFTVLYGVLMIADVSLLVRYARNEPATSEDATAARAY